MSVSATPFNNLSLALSYILITDFFKTSSLLLQSEQTGVVNFSIGSSFSLIKSFWIPAVSV